MNATMEPNGISMSTTDTRISVIALAGWREPAPTNGGPIGDVGGATRVGGAGEVGCGEVFSNSVSTSSGVGTAVRPGIKLRRQCSQKLAKPVHSGGNDQQCDSSQRYHRTIPTPSGSSDPFR